MKVRAPVILGLFLASMVLSGCINADEDLAAAPDDLELDEALDETISIDDDGQFVAEGIAWEIGDYWTWTFPAGPDDTDLTFEIVVVGETPNAYQRRSADPLAAKLDATSGSGWWVLGDWSKSGDVGRIGHDWNWYNFPLIDGKTWTDRMAWNGEDRDIVKTVTYAEEIEHAGGSSPGFLIEAVVEGTPTSFLYDFVPEVGASTQWRVSQDGEEIFANLISDYGSDFTGTTYEVEAVELVDHASFMHNFEPTAPVVNPSPTMTFTPDPAATEIVMEVGTWVWGGTADTRVHAPGGTTYESQSVGTPGDPEATFDIQTHYFAPEQGEYRLFTNIAGDKSWAWVWAAELWVTEIPV